jgi:16S rRNA (cytosine967-C5)-methyltransferase
VRPDISEVAAEIIRTANREKPADAAMREVFQRLRLPSFDTAEISRMVFSFYRWFGWLENEKDLKVRIKDATALAGRFRHDPVSISIDELRAKTVPGWTSDEVDVSDEWLRSLQQEPRLWLRPRRGQGGVLAGKLGGCRPLGTGALADILEYSGDKDLFRTPEFHRGEFELQDVSSQAVGFICDPKPGETWWDACAGEGGKLLHLSQLMDNKGLIWASDRAAWRLQKLKRRAARAGAFNYRAAAWPGGAKLPTKTRFDGVLLDAPCSGVGTWQRNPHARWTTTPDDVEELSALQKELLSHAAPSVKPGGRLIYAVCTLTKSETVGVADDFENHFKEFKPLALANPLASELPVSARIWIRPQQSGGNGMFVAVWERGQ